MDRRQALSKMIGAGAVIAGAPLLASSTAFADGGSLPTCRPTPTPSTILLTASVTGLRKNAIRISAGPSMFSAATCPCPGDTAGVQYRWEIIGTTSPNPIGLYPTATGGSPISGFSPLASSVTLLPVFIREIGGTALTSATYDVRLTIRYVCTKPDGTSNWSCQGSAITTTFTTAGGADGTITSQSTVAIPPPDNSASCDSPAP